nr:alpha/beta fold hydrolase [uncultured Carboxylicivirga sp.]
MHKENSVSEKVLGVVDQSSGYHQHLFYRLYNPQREKIHATLLILHGMQEHSGRYKTFANYTAERGIAVLIYDHLGHGKTARNVDDFGFIAKNKGADKLVNDAVLMVDYLQQQFPEVPHFLAGHSMGSFIARCVLQQHSSMFKGAIIIGTGTTNQSAIYSKAFLALLNKVAPRMKSPFINKIFSSMNEKKFRNEDDFDGTNWLSLNNANRRAFCEDPLCGLPFTNNGFYNLVQLNIKATKQNWAKNINKHYPLLFSSGENDPIGNFGKGVKQTVNALKKEGFDNVNLHLYPNLRHEVLNEENKEEVFNDIIDNWLLKLV